MKKPKYQPESCQSCGQTTTYALSLDHGSAHIVLAVANAVRRLNRNRVHLRNDMEAKSSQFADYRKMVEGGYMTSRMVDNVLRAKYHGLLAQVEGGGRGEYLLTPKGAQFLRGAAVPRVAVVDKAHHQKKFYLDGENDKVTIGQLLTSEPYWVIPELDGIDGYSTEQGELF